MRLHVKPLTILHMCLFSSFSKLKRHTTFWRSKIWKTINDVGYSLRFLFLDLCSRCRGQATKYYCDVDGWCKYFLSLAPACFSFNVCTNQAALLECGRTGKQCWAQIVSLQQCYQVLSSFEYGVADKLARGKTFRLKNILHVHVEICERKKNAVAQHCKLLTQTCEVKILFSSNKDENSCWNSKRCHAVKFKLVCK